MAYRIDNATAAAAMPTPGAVGPNVDAFFTGGDPGLGVPATRVDADWLNAVQEEICNVIEAASITLDKTEQDQLLQAIKYIVQAGASSYAASTTAANTYVATLTPAPSAYTAGMKILIKFTNHNTGAATINLNSLGAKSIKRLDGSALSASDIADGMIALMVYDGTNFQLIGLNLANYVSMVQHQNDTANYAASTTSPNTYTATLATTLTAYQAGQRFSIKFTNANTSTTPTLNIDAVGAKTIVRGDLTALKIGDIAAGMIAELRYDGTYLQLLNPAVNTAVDTPAGENLILGGDFSINPFQRATTGSSVANGQFMADRFRHVKSGSGVISYAQDSSLAPSVDDCGRYVLASLKNTVTTAAASPGANDYYGIEYPMDGPRFMLIAQSVFTLSFWVRASVTGTYSVAFKNYGRDRSYIGQYTINSANTWEYKTITVAASPAAGTWDYASNAGLYIVWYYGAGSSRISSSIGSWQTGELYAGTGQANNMATNSNTFNIALVQCERGYNATRFKWRDPSVELEMLQAFFEKTYSFNADVGATVTGGAIASQQVTTGVGFLPYTTFNTVKRQSPTITWYSDVTGASGKVRNTATNADITVSSSGYVGIHQAGIANMSSSVNADTTLTAHYTAECEVA